MSKGNRKFAQVLANSVLSEYSTPVETCSSSDAEYYEPPNPSKIKDFDFIEQTIDGKDPSSKRLMNMYDVIDKLRNTRWQLTFPEQVGPHNMRALKLLIAKNFTKHKHEVTPTPIIITGRTKLILTKDKKEFYKR